MSDIDQRRLDKLFEELVALNGPLRSPTALQLKKAEQIHIALDSLLGQTPLTSEQRAQADRLFTQLDGIFETRQPLSKEAQKRVDELTDEIDILLNRCESREGLAPY